MTEKNVYKDEITIFPPSSTEEQKENLTKREDSWYGMKADVDENGILTMENGDKFNLREER